MQPDHLEKTEQHAKAGFKAIRTKFHLEEVGLEIADAISKFHRPLGHFIENAAKKIPLINLLIAAIGNIASIVTYRKKRTPFEKFALGVKVTTGLISLGLAVAAFSVPLVSVPLIITGSLINIAYTNFSIYKSYRRKVALEKELLETPLTNTTARHEIERDITKLQDEIKEHKEKIVEKTIANISGTIAIVGTIIMLANPITVVPISIILAVTATAYTAYHFRKPIISGLKRLGSWIKNKIVGDNTPNNTDEQTDANTQQHQQTSQHTATVQQTNSITDKAQVAATAAVAPDHASENATNFLHHQESILAHESVAHAQTYQEQHTPAPVIADAVAPESETSTMAIMHDNDEDEDEEGGEGGEGGQGEQDIDASREYRTAAELELRP